MISPDDLTKLIAKEQSLARWYSLVNLLNVALVALTFFLTFMSNRLSVWLNAATEQRTLREKQISDQRIAESNLQAKNAKSMAEEAKIEQQKLAIKSKEGQKELDENRKELALAKQKQAASELALEEVKKKQNPRKLTHKEKNVIRACLESTKKGIVYVSFKALNEEARDYSDEFAYFLSTIGFEIVKDDDTYYDRDTKFGVSFYHAPDTDIPVFIQQLHSAMLKAGITVKFVKQPDIDKGKVQLFIGEKQ